MTVTDLETELIKAGVISGEIGTCQGAKTHNPRPLVVLDHLLYEDGPSVPLCSLCRDNYRALWALLDLYRGNVPWEVTRRFGNTILALGVKSWSNYHHPYKAA